MKNSNDTNGNQTRDLPVCSAMPQPTASDLLAIICVVVCYTVKQRVRDVGLQGPKHVAVE
jgi:hypothetical protein